MKSVGEAIKIMDIMRVSGAAPTTMNGICYDSRLVRPGNAFVAIKGEKSDGHDFIAEAIKRGATTIVAERDPAPALPENVTLIIANNTREALARMSGYFYDSPSKELDVIGITGTNGKTTVAYLVESLLTAGGHKCGRIGTTGYEIIGRSYPAITTTPESADLQKMLREAVSRGATKMALEVSSHAIAMNRVDAVKFKVAVFTNLTRDHLDFHGDIDSYFNTKARLFTDFEPEISIINVDDTYASRLLGIITTNLMTYGLEGFSDITAENLATDANGITMTLKTPSGSAPVHSPLIGLYNVYNILAAAAVAIAEGVAPDVIAKGLNKFAVVPGRFERIDEGQPYSVVVDYAHTDDALANVIKTARSLTGKKVITLFGCGGDRDHTKRPLMGKVASTLSDHVVVTSDNPRTEDENKIIDQILEGIEKSKKPDDALFIIPDRREAIKKAIDMAEPGDFVLIAGKGHEDYQIVGTTKHHFDDREEARAAIRKRHGAI